MKKLILAVLVLTATASMAQTNLQVMYDFGNSRKNVTSTLEMFKPDKWGDTFFFVDMEFNGGAQKQPSLAYMEIARCLKFWDGPISAQVEYNGGLLLSGAVGFPINNAYLAGVDYAWHDKDFTKFLNFKVLYKSIQGKNPNSFQLTGVWNLNYLNKKLTFSGFADFWFEKTHWGTNTTNTVFISEPQLWYNFSKHFSLGGEVEVATNFAPVEGFNVCPTLGAKWNF